MPFVIDNDILNLDEMTENTEISDKNMYISNEDKALELIADLIKNKSNSSLRFQEKIKSRINYLFSLFSEVKIENGMILYDRFMELCSRLSELQKIKKLQSKVVIGLGGKVSAGKSKFINKISGIGDKLPVDQKTTTAIPTYIIKSKLNNIYANSVYGYSLQITSEALNAMAHEFDNVYGIGFQSFVDSIIIESCEYTLPEEIALLDTPGYTKLDIKSNSKKVLSDKEKAYEQLSVADYLIWLIEIDSGTLTEDDIDFIRSLGMKTPILIVFTKADVKTEADIKQIIDYAKTTIENNSIDCFGITAYSAKEEKEYFNNYIQKFFDYSISDNVRNSNIISEFYSVEKEMRKSINKTIDEFNTTSQRLFSYICSSNDIMSLSSLTKLWGKTNQDKYILEKLLRKYDFIIAEINSEINNHFVEGK